MRRFHAPAWGSGRTSLTSRAWDLPIGPTSALRHLHAPVLGMPVSRAASQISQAEREP